jgi:hypothetical protein
MDADIIKKKLQNEYDKIIETKWNFLYNKYEPINNKKFHRTQLQEIKNIDKIKKNIENKIGATATFVFLTDFCSQFNIPGPYRHVDKALVLLEHLLCGISINQMESYMPFTNFFRIYKYIYIEKYEELNNWINTLMYNCFSNKRIRLLTSLLNNPDMMKHVTMILDGHHSRIIYENISFDKQDLYSWKLKKPGLNTQFIIDLNKIILYVSDSLPCKWNNDDKMLINNIDFNRFFTLYDNICFDGLYINTLNETIEKFSIRNLDMRINNFTFPIEKKKNIKLTNDQEVYNKYIGGFRSTIETFFAHFGNIFNRFKGDANVRVTKLDTYNIQLRLCSVLYNIKIFCEVAHIQPLHEHFLWLQDNFDFPDKNNITISINKLENNLNNIISMKNYQTDLINSILTNDASMEDIFINNATNLQEKEKSYEVQYIIKHRLNKNGIKEYFVKWRGYTKKHNSWVLETNFLQKDMINEYNNDLMEEEL